MRNVLTTVLSEVGYLPNNSLGAGANGLEILVAFENGEASIADLDGVEVRVARGGRHGANGRRVGHGPPRLKNIEDKVRVTYDTTYIQKCHNTRFTGTIRRVGRQTTMER